MASQSSSAASVAAQAESSPKTVSHDSSSTSTSSASSATASSNKWNTKNLGLRLAADAVSAACAASLIAPLIAIVDRSIMENASGRNSLASSVASSLRNLIFRPHTLLLSKPTALIFLTYGSTYLVANNVDTAFSTARNKPASTVTAGTAKFVASSATNIGIGIYKDQVFARMYGPPGGSVRPVPPASYVLFALRDCITIFASFNVPPMLGPLLDKHVLPAELQAKVSGAYAAQFLAPAAVQFVSTPPHLLGLDLYNRPSAAAGAVISAGDRLAAVRRNWIISSCARIGRIVPAFGIGGVVNIKVRRNLMGKLE